jgi:hypothetical protein
MRSVGESCNVEIALIMADFSCLILVLRQELLFTARDTGFLIWLELHEYVPQISVQNQKI